MKAMIFAAGLGTRMRPFTDLHPKALVVVSGKTLLQRNIEYLARYGITDLIINVHHFADQVIDFLRLHQGFGSRITISEERNEVLETGGGFKKVSWFFEDAPNPFVLINSDILTDLDLGAMISYHTRSQSLATLAVTSRPSTRNFLFNQEGILCGWSNSLTGERRISRVADTYIPFAFSGVHVLSPRISSLMDREGKFSIVDLYLDLASIHPIRLFDHSGSRFIDVGKPESIVKAEVLFKD